MARGFLGVTIEHTHIMEEEEAEEAQDYLRKEVLRRLSVGGDDITTLVTGIADEHRAAHIKYLERHLVFYDTFLLSFPCARAPFADVCEACDYMTGDYKCPGGLCNQIGKHCTPMCGARNLYMPWLSSAEDLELYTEMQNLCAVFDYVIEVLAARGKNGGIDTFRYFS